MGRLGESDVAAMLADLEKADGTVEVGFGALITKGLLDHAAVELLGEQMPGVVGADRIIHIATDSLPGLVSGLQITVDDVGYIVREVLPYGDGAMTMLPLRRV